MSAYRVDVQRSAKRDLERLSPPLLDRVVKRLLEIGAEPRGPGAKRLATGDAYRAPVGDYGIVFEIDDRGRVVVVTRIRHRREVYRKLR